MTLEQLRIFIAVAEQQHMTQAAQALNLTQSATSAAIAALEERHDIRLFDRIGRRIELTELGRAFLPEARAVVARAQEAAGLLSASAGLLRGQLDLAASQTAANYWLPPLMYKFRQAYPGIALKLLIMNTRDACQSVVEGTADLGFVEDQIEVPTLARHRATRDQMVLIAAPHLSGVATDPAKAQWVMREKGSGTRAILEHALQAADIKPASIVLELPSNEAVRAAVEAGAGISALSRLVVEPSLANGRLIVLPHNLPAREFFAINSLQRHVSRAADAFLRHVLAQHTPEM